MTERFMQVTGGVYGETERSTYRPRLRPATALEQRRLSRQSFMYFMPFLPLAVCPEMPDVLQEFCSAHGRDLDVVHWKIDRQLVPRLAARQIDTGVLFGIRSDVGGEVINFANGVILQDQGKRLAYRLVTASHQLIEPGVSLARPAEKILADRLTVQVLNVQSVDSGWELVLNDPPVDFRVVKLIRRDVYLCQIVKAFWSRGLRTRILG